MHCECHCHEPQRIVLFSGDDSNFVGNQTIFIGLDTEIDITGCKAHIKYIGKTFTWDTIPSDHRLELVFSAEETKNMPLGDWNAELWLEDAQGRRRTVDNQIRIRVTKSVDDAYRSEDPQSIKASIGNKFNYNNAYNKPTLNGVVIEGNKTSRDYHIEGGGGGGNMYRDEANEITNSFSLHQGLALILGYNQDIRSWMFGGVIRDEQVLGLREFYNDIGAEFERIWADIETKANADSVYTKDETYSSSEIDQKINQFAAHYLTTKNAQGQFVPFATHAALAAAKAALITDPTKPQFWYADTAHVPDKNDYCVVLDDETHDHKTTRYAFVGDWLTGFFRYQYTINETAFSQAQWDAINSGITSELIEQTTDAINGKQDKLAVNASGVYQIQVSLATDAMSASHASIADSADVADRALADSDGKGFATTYARILSDTVVGKIDEDRHDDSISAKIVRVPIEFARRAFNAVKVTFHEYSTGREDGVFLGIGYSSGTGGTSGLNYTDTILGFSNDVFVNTDVGEHVYRLRSDILSEVPDDAKFLTFFFTANLDISAPAYRLAPIETGYATDAEVAQKKYQIQETDGFFHLEHAPLMEFLIANDPVARKSSVDSVSSKVDEIRETVSTNNRFLVNDTTAAVQTREDEDADWSDEIRLDKGYDALQGTEMVKLDKSVQTVTVDGGTLEVILPELSSDGTVRDLCLYVNNTPGADVCTLTFPAGTYYGADGWDSAAQKGGITGYYFSEIPGNGWRVAREEFKQFTKGATS